MVNLPPEGKDAIMSRRWFALTSGLVVSTAIVPLAFSQTPSRSTSLAERMAAMRRGWSQGESPSAQGSRPVMHNGEAGSRGGSPPTSMWSKFVGQDSDQPAATRAGVQSRTASSRVRGTTQPRDHSNGAEDTLNPAVRMASRPRAGSAQLAGSDDTNGTLPGLGGSPLPQSASAAARATALGAPDISHEIASDYPIGRSAGASASTPSQRAGSAPEGVMSANAQSVGTASVRQSPQRRNAASIDPEELRRELAGSTPASSDSSGRIATTARADGTGELGGTAGESEPMSEPELPAQESPRTDARTTPPANDTAPIRIGGDATGGATDVGAVATDLPAETGSPSVNDASAPGKDFGAAFSENKFLRAPRSNSHPAASPSPRGPSAFDPLRPAKEVDSGVLVSNKTPVITTDIRGPKQILIGREAAYRVQLRNQGDVAAEGMVASIRIPSWAEVVDTAASQGVIAQAGDTMGSGNLEWQLARLEAQGSETLDIRLIPRASRPLELGVSWTITPVGSRAVVEVQEPKLQMTVSGPDEVLFSQPQVFRLTLTNPGTGVAENVKIDLMPPSGGEKVVTTQPIGNLPPGASKTVEIELTPKEAGKLFVKAVATAEGGLTSDASKEIFCRKPELEVDWRGPETKYAGTSATYFFRVRNPGTAPAENVTVRVTLPEGAEFTSASEGQSFDDKRREVAWQVGTLAPGDDSYMELKCIVNTPGANQFRIAAASSSGDLADNKLAETNVVALADLKLDVSDPSGPVAVGEQAVYEIRVQNRGASAAKDVNIVALFSEGLEPDQVEGAMYTVTDGRVSFRTIDELQAGREIGLRIRARASKAGTHVFRAEVLCRDLEIKLAAEETTRFYSDEVADDSSERLQPAQSASQGFESATR
jgi:uncharacterized repeat protein (TIGR01451 family)